MTLVLPMLKAKKIGVHLLEPRSIGETAIRRSKAAFSVVIQPNNLDVKRV